MVDQEVLESQLKADRFPFTWAPRLWAGDIAPRHEARRGRSETPHLLFKRLSGDVIRHLRTLCNERAPCRLGRKGATALDRDGM
jgi:hypothetical protein